MILFLACSYEQAYMNRGSGYLRKEEWIAAEKDFTKVRDEAQCYVDLILRYFLHMGDE